MALNKEGRRALVCCLVFLCPRVKATEELEMAWMQKVSVQEATIAAVVGDVSGCTFVTGDTSEHLGPGYPDLGQRDAYLSKYDPDGELMWIYLWGTEDLDSGSCLTVDAEGNCFVGGYTNGSLAPNLIEDIGDTQQDAFVAKISSEGAGPCQFIIEAKATLDDPYQLLVDNSTNTTSASLMKPLQDTFPITDVRYVHLTVTGDARHSASIHEVCLSGVLQNGD